MKKTYMTTESRKFEFSAHEVKKILVTHLQDEYMNFMGDEVEIFTDEHGDTTLTCIDGVTSEEEVDKEEK